MKIKIDDKAMINKYLKSNYGEDYLYYTDGLEIMDEHIISLNDNPILVCGNPAIIDFEDEEIFYKDNSMICGKGNNRKWRELKDDYGNGKLSDPYIMTYETMVDTFGEDDAKILFDTGDLPDEWC